MGKDDGGEAVWKEAVKEAPDDAGDEGGHEEHEIAGTGMDKGIEEGGEGKGGVPPTVAGSLFPS